MSRFHIKIFALNGKQLASRTEREVREGLWGSCPYVKLNFDNFKAFRSEVSRKRVADPEWSFETDFWYETRFPNQLNVKKFIVEVFDYTESGKHKLIGWTSVDLLTLATGPIAHDLILATSSSDAVADPRVNNLHFVGRIRFKLEMEEFADTTIDIKNVVVKLTNSAFQLKETSYLTCRYQGLKKILKFKIRRKTMNSLSGNKLTVIEEEVTGNEDDENYNENNEEENEEDESVALIGNQTDFEDFRIRLGTSLKQLVEASVIFCLRLSRRRRRNSDIRALIKFKKYYKWKVDREIPFEENLILHPSKEVIGVLRGVLVIKCPAKFAQFIDGVHTEKGCRGKPLLEGVPLPPRYLGLKETSKKTRNEFISYFVKTKPQRREGHSYSSETLRALGIDIPIAKTEPQVFPPTESHVVSSPLPQNCRQNKQQKINNNKRRQLAEIIPLFGANTETTFTNPLHTPPMNVSGDCVAQIPLHTLTVGQTMDTSARSSASVTTSTPASSLPSSEPTRRRRSKESPLIQKRPIPPLQNTESPSIQKSRPRKESGHHRLRSNSLPGPLTPEVLNTLDTQNSVSLTPWLPPPPPPLPTAMTKECQSPQRPKKHSLLAPQNTHDAKVISGACLIQGKVEHANPTPVPRKESKDSRAAPIQSAVRRTHPSASPSPANVSVKSQRASAPPNYTPPSSDGFNFNPYATFSPVPIRQMFSVGSNFSSNNTPVASSASSKTGDPTNKNK